MSLKPFFSVVIATYNRLPQLQKTLACIFQQTFPQSQYEVIVVDDGSNDGTISYLRKLSTQHKLQFIGQTHRGSATSRNTGASVAIGEILVFTDDDCLPEPGWLEALAVSYLPKDDLSIVAVGGRIENVSKGHWLYRFYALQGKRHRANHSKTPKYLDTANVSFRREAFYEVGGFNEVLLFGDDEDISYRFVAAGFSLRTNFNAIVWHVGRPSLLGMMKESYKKGIGVAILMIKYPEMFYTPPHREYYSQIHHFLNGLLKLTLQPPLSVRSLTYGLVATLRRIAFVLADIIPFLSTYLPTQIGKFRKSDVSRLKIACYVILEWVDYIASNSGQIIGTLINTFQLDDNEKIQFIEKILLVTRENDTTISNKQKRC